MYLRVAGFPDECSFGMTPSSFRRIVADLLTWHVEELELLLPPDRKEEVGQHQSVLRGCCDHVASPTERQAGLLYRRMAGIAPGVCH